MASQKARKSSDAYSGSKEANVHSKSEYEKVQPFAREFWQTPEGIRAFKLLTGYDKHEQKLRELGPQLDALYRQVTDLNELLDRCLKHKEPIFTLELPDEILLKLADYGSVGEVLLAFKLDKNSRQRLENELGKTGFSLLGSRLISKGYLKANDKLFQAW